MIGDPKVLGLKPPYTIPNLFEQAFSRPSAARWDFILRTLIWLRVCYKETSPSIKPDLAQLEVIARWERNHSPDFISPSLNQLNFQQP